MKLSPLFFIDLLNAAQIFRDKSPLEFLTLWIATVVPWAFTLVTAMALIAQVFLEGRVSSAANTNALAMIVLPLLVPYGYVWTRLLLHRHRLLCFSPWLSFSFPR